MFKAFREESIQHTKKKVLVERSERGGLERKSENVCLRQ